MRIAVVTNIAWNLFNFRRGLIDALTLDGHDVVLASAKDGYEIHLERMGYRFVPLKNMERTGRNPLADARLFLEFRAFFEKHSIDAVILYHSKSMIYGGLAASFSGIPYIATITGLAGPFTGERFLVQKIVTLLYRVSLRGCCKVFFQNDEDMLFFLKRKIVKEEITDRVGGSGINLDLFAIKPLPSSGSGIVFLLFARLSYSKGIQYYANVARRLKLRFSDCRFLLAGPYDEDELAISKQTVDGWVNEGSIEYLGVSDFIQREIELADVIVYPSYYKEGAPRSLIESAAMGRPIITTDNVGCREVVIDCHNGFLIPIKDEEALERSMVKMIEMSKDERKSMGLKGRAHVARFFDERQVISKYLQVLKTLDESKG